VKSSHFSTTFGHLTIRHHGRRGLRQHRVEVVKCLTMVDESDGKKRKPYSERYIKLSSSEPINKITTVKEKGS